MALLQTLRTKASSGIGHTLSLRWLDWLHTDGRHYQIIYQFIFLLYGINYLEWDDDINKYLLAAGVCIALQLIGTRFTTKDYSSVKSALISALSICLMLKANLLTTVAIAAALSIGSKFIIRYKGKHVFNPTNFGIILTILITGDAWISPGQWGSQGMLLFLIGAAGFIVLLRVKRLDIAVMFLLTYLGLHFFRNVIWLGWPVDFFFHQLTSGTLLLFTFFMITDPVSTPSHPAARIIWASLIGVLAFFLSWKMQVHTAPVWALFFLSPLTIILDKIFVHEKFSWRS